MTWQITVHAGLLLSDTVNLTTGVTCQITAATVCSSGATESDLIPAGWYLTVRVARAAGSGTDKEWRYSFEY